MFSPVDKDTTLFSFLYNLIFRFIWFWIFIVLCICAFNPYGVMVAGRIWLIFDDSVTLEKAYQNASLLSMLMSPFAFLMIFKGKL